MTFEPRSAHRTHDALLVAGYASGDLDPADAERVERWIHDCSVCAALHADVVSISGALAALPKTANAPRDFRLSPAQAARLRGGPWWRRLGRALVAPRGLGRPLATAFTTLGLVGLLIGNLPAGFLSQAGGASPESAFVDDSATQGAPLPAAAPSPQDTSSAFGPAEGSGDGRTGYASGADASPTVMKDDLATTDSPAAETAAPTTVPGPLAISSPTDGRAATPATSPVIALGIAFLAIGLGLFAVRRLGGRLT